MAHSSTDIKAKDPLSFEPDGAEIDTPDNPSLHQFRVNYLKMLDWTIDVQLQKLDRFNFLSERAANFRENIVEIRSDPQGDGVTREERDQLHEFQDRLHHTIDRIDAMPDFDTMSDRLLRLEMDFIHKSDEWDLSI